MERRYQRNRWAYLRARTMIGNMRRCETCRMFHNTAEMLRVGKQWHCLPCFYKAVKEKNGRDNTNSVNAGNVADLKPTRK